MSAATALAAARRRHPSARWPLPVDHLLSRVGELLEMRGAPHADVAARVLAARGRTGLDFPTFARRLGIDDHTLRDAEAGRVPIDRLPAPLQRLVG